jgi:hypothetical protein
MSSTFKFYCDGNVQFVDSRVTRPVTFAHVTDLHLPGVPRQDWPPRYRHAIAWWNEEMEYPDRTVSKLLDQISAAGVDFIFFGGDVIDYYNAGAANQVLELCRERGLTAWFQLGNHDGENEYTRFVSHEFDAEYFAQNTRHLCEHWHMPGLNYRFDVDAIRFLSFSVEFRSVDGIFVGVVTDEQADWVIEQLNHDGALVIFHHIPFALPTVAPRLKHFWSGKICCIIEDNNGRRIREAIAQNPNVLGTFAGHTHMRSEDPFGKTWQFINGPAHLGEWRYVRISGEPPPKSLNIAGEPTVDE